jgi:hypothetical protein
VPQILNREASTPALTVTAANANANASRVGFPDVFGIMPPVCICTRAPLLRVCACSCCHTSGVLGPDLTRRRPPL